MVDKTKQTQDDVAEGKKASLGVNAEIPDPVEKTAKVPGGEAIKAEKAAGSNKKQGSSKTSKVQMINTIVDAVKGMKKEDVDASFAKIMSVCGVEGFEDLEEEDDRAISIRELKRITADDVDVSEDVAAMFAGDTNLSEDFVNKATTIFEAAVVSKVNEIIESVTIDIESDLEQEVEEIRNVMAENIGMYLDYVVENWMAENELAIESSLRAEIAENLMAGMHTLFTENFISVPEEKVEVVEELVSRNEDLEEAISEEIEKNIELSEMVADLKKDMIFDVVAEDLTDTQKEKLYSLAEGVDYTDDDTYLDNLETIKSNYFSPENASTSTKRIVSESLDDSDGFIELQDDNDEVGLDPRMATYMTVISKAVKNK